MNPFAATVHELFADNLPARAAKPFIVDPDAAFSYADVDAEVGRIAAALTAQGIKPGDRVVVQLRKSMREAAAMLAVARIGAVIVNVSTMWTSQQLSFVAEDSAAAALIVEPAMADRLGSFRTGFAVLVNGDCDALPDCISWQGHSADGMDACARLDTELAAIIYTSGSTGTPKGVMLSHRNIVAGARSVGRYLDLSERDRILSVLPYSFDYGLNQLTSAMLVGATIIHQPVPMASEVVRALVEHEATGLAAVPPLWIQIVRLLEAAPRSLPTLRYVTNSGGKIPPSILAQMPQVFPGTDIVLMYGLTEAFRSTYLPPDRFAAKMGAIGRAIPNAEIFVVTPDGALAGPGEQGELVHRGPLVSLGYWNRPEATAEKIRPCPALIPLIGDEPVVFSGDTVRIDEDGDIWFVGRRDNLIKSSGFRISPDDVEDLVHSSGLAADVVAFGVEDELLGQSVHVAVSLLPGASIEQLQAHCRRVMPAYMVPRQVHVLPEAMPRTASGKLARPRVVERCRNDLSRTDA